MPTLSVKRSEALERVRLLPRRDWQDYPLEEAAKLLTQELRTPRGTMDLRPVQAVALMELHDFGGVFAPIQVGGGKTLTSLLAPIVAGAKRPVLVVPASLRDKTKREAREYAKHWHIPPISVQSYQTLSRTSGQEWLDSKAPDLLIFDECHYVKNPRAAVTKKINRYLRANPHTKVMAMSGTASGRSLRDFWHIIRWCLRDRAPVPQRWEDMIEWSQALDAKVDDFYRLAPGALLTLGSYEPDHAPLEQARQAFGDRMYSTPGVVVVKDSRPDAGLEIRAKILDLPPTLDDAFTTLRTRWETPDGHPFEDAFSLWRHARELACGFYYVWDPRPPEPWLTARREISGFIRDTLSGSRTLDSPFQVMQAIDRFHAGGWGTKMVEDTTQPPESYCPETGEPIYPQKRVSYQDKNPGVDDGGALARWRAIRETFKPNSVPNWIDTTALEAAAEWLERERGLCWVEHRAFGLALADLTGIPHFQERGTDPKTGRAIDQHRGPAIAQAKPCSTGFNLQHHHYKNLIVSCEPTGKQYEQLLGRTHRDGQEADTVFVDILLGCTEQYGGFVQACKDAAFAQKTPPSLQKLCYATLDVPSIEEVKRTHGGSAAWT